GLTATPDIYFTYFRTEPEAEEREPPSEKLLARLPKLNMATWITVLCMAGVFVGLIVGGILAIYTYSTPNGEMPLFDTILALFLTAVAAQVLDATLRQWFPAGELDPSPAVTLRGRPQLDGATRMVVGLLTLVLVGLVLGGILAIYDWTTPGAEMPLFFAVLALFVIACAVKVLSVTVRHLQQR
ncbi:MAG: hypothetical protein ACREQ5_33605, partial [Candidatus Dormibacteria bacterium]